LAQDVSAEKKQIVEDFGATAIDYRSCSVDKYVEEMTEGKGFDIVFDTVGGATIKREVSDMMKRCA